MGFDQRQRKALRSKLRHANVRSRIHNGTTLHYIEGWKVVAEANRIFGHENWDRETRTPTCIWSDRQRGQVVCLYSTQVRISVRAGDTIVTRDGVGTGFGRSSSPEGAHEMAMKAAETDATKRALATFGNPFGLALYDKEMSQVTQPTKQDQTPDKRPSRTEAPKVILTGRNGQQRRLSSSDHLVDAVTTSLAELETVEAVYGFWEANLANFASVLERDPIANRAVIDVVTEKLKARLRDVGGQGGNGKSPSPPPSASAFLAPSESAPPPPSDKDASSHAVSAEKGETTSVTGRPRLKRRPANRLKQRPKAPMTTKPCLWRARRTAASAMPTIALSLPGTHVLYVDAVRLRPTTSGLPSRAPWR